MERWKGRVAVVAGAANEIGNAICRELLKHGLTVVSFDCEHNIGVNGEDLEKTAREYPGKLHIFRHGSLRTEDLDGMMEKIARRFGGIDVCINNTGFPSINPVPHNMFQTRTTVNIEVNDLALMACMNHVVGTTPGVHEGVIINLDSHIHRRILRDDEGEERVVIPSKIVEFSQALRSVFKEGTKKIQVWTIGMQTADSTDLLNNAYASPAQVVNEIVRILQNPSEEEVNEYGSDILLPCL